LILQVCCVYITFVDNLSKKPEDTIMILEGTKAEIANKASEADRQLRHVVVANASNGEEAAIFQEALAP
jgi:hypothetical protein